MACAGDVRREIEATDGTIVTPAPRDAGSRVSRLTTRIVNGFRTNPATQLFQVSRSNRTARYLDMPRKKFLLGGGEPSARRKDTLRSRGYQGRCAPLGGACRWSASLTAAPLRADGQLSAEG